MGGMYDILFREGMRCHICSLLINLINFAKDVAAPPESELPQGTDFLFD